MKIALIGSSQYSGKFLLVQRTLSLAGHTVKMPAFDDIQGNELDIIEYNRFLIKWADEVHVIWDGRSVGTIFDFGMVFAFGKKLVIEYIEPKNFVNAMRLYESSID